MGTMLQAADLVLDDFAGLEGCNEILNDTRPDVVRDMHRAYFAAGADAVETNTFGANLPNLAEYGIPERIRELAEKATVLAREVADEMATADRPRFVLGSVGPGTKLPTLGHESVRPPPRRLRRMRTRPARGRGGRDRRRDLPGPAAGQGRHPGRAQADGRRGPVRVPIVAQVAVETTGTMLLGSEIGAALTALEALGVDLIGLNCSTGPAEMSEHLRTLAKHARIPLSVMPNAGLPVLGPNGAEYPLDARRARRGAHAAFVAEYGTALVGGCCGTTPEHIATLVDAMARRRAARAPPAARAGGQLALRPGAVPPGHVRADGRRADQRQRVRRSSARPCWPRTGRPASASRASRPARART